MRLKLLIIALFAFIALYPSQSRAISWKTFTDSRRVNTILEYGGELWAGTGGGVLRFHPDGSNLIMYTNSEGLGDNSIGSSIAAGGYIWFGSETGKLSRFDPSDGSWRIFVLRDRDGNSIAIHDIEASTGFLWLATDIGISKFDIFRNGGEIKETYRRLGNFTVELPILTVFIEGDTIAAAGAEGIVMADISDNFLQDFTHWNSATEFNSTGFPEPGITGAAIIHGAFVVGTTSGLYSVTEGEGSFLWEVIALTGEAVINIQHSGSQLLLTSDSRLDTYDGTSFVSVDLSGLPSSEFVSSFLYGDEVILGTSDQGLYIGSNGWQNVLVDGPGSNQIVDVAADSEGKIWTVLKPPVISSYDGDNWEHVDLPRSEVGQWAIAIDHEDNVWVGTWQNGAFQYDGDTLVKYDTTNSTLHGNQEGENYIVLRDLDVDDAGRVWFPCYRGYPMRPVSFYDPSTDRWGYYTSAEGFTDNFILSIHVVDEYLWTGFENAGVFRTYIGTDPFNHSDISSKQYTTLQNLPSDEIRVISSDLNSTVWVGTNAGLAYYDEGIDRFIRVELPAGAGPQINAIETDPRNNLWIGTSNSLVLLTADGTGFEVFTTANSDIAGNEITSLFYDEDGYLWIGTSSGLSRLDYAIGIVTDNVDDVLAYPNPFIVPNNGRVYFNYDGVADVSIFTLSGELVVKTNTSRGWDGANESGELVAGGMYLFLLTAPNGDSHTGKIALVRK
jgi:ligand-binding sensor domain-containing protein